MKALIRFRGDPFNKTPLCVPCTPVFITRKYGRYVPHFKYVPMVQQQDEPEIAPDDIGEKLATFALHDERIRLSKEHKRLVRHKNNNKKRKARKEAVTKAVVSKGKTRTVGNKKRNRKKVRKS